MRKEEFTFSKRNSLSLAEQRVAMLKLYPEFNCTWDRNHILWIGEIRPTPISNLYTISISYSLEVPPIVEVINPKLKSYNNEPIPHMYKQKELCLYYPKKREWTKQDYIGETIIPWTSEWLYFYEVWQVTGEWKGEGIHPEKGARNILVEDR